MVKCCAIGCRNPGTHLFPKDYKLRILWEKAVNRKNFIATKHSRLCSAHFTSEDYVSEGFYTGLQNKRKILRKGVVPTSFIKLENNISNKVIRQSHANNLSILALNSKKSDYNILCVESGIQKLKHCSIGTQKFFSFFSIDSFQNDNKRINFYTGLKTYDLFIKVFQSLGPDADSLCYKRNQDLDMPPKDQFLLTLTKLKRNHDDYELAFFFDVHQSSIVNIVNTWVNFIYSIWNDKYKINNQMLDVIAEEENDNGYDILNEPNSFSQEEISHNSTIQDLEHLENLFSIIKDNKDEMYTILLPKIIYICKILIYFSKNVQI